MIVPAHVPCRSLALSLCLAAIGCDADGLREPDAFGGNQPDVPVDGDELPVSPIKGGEEGGLQQAVHLNLGDGRLCTGVLLNQSALLTAAHCVAPVKDFKGAFVSGPTLDFDMAVDAGRVWVYDEYHYTQGGAPGEKYDVAVVGLRWPIDELTTDRGDVLATVASSRLEDGSALWINGRMKDGAAFDGIMRATTVIDPLPPEDPRYPYQLLDTENPPQNPGDSGGPLFRERVGEPNDGQGGAIAPIIYGVVSRGGSHTRLDPVKNWIDTRAEQARRANINAVGDWDWAICDRDQCPVWMTSNLDGSWEFLANVPRDTRMGVFVQNGDELVVSYPMEDRDRKVQVIDRSAWRYGGSTIHGAPPTEDLRVEDRYCQASTCLVYAKRDLSNSDVTPIGEVPCGFRMGVFVKTADWAVVSYPMDDRARAVQIVPNGSGWGSTPGPGCS